MVMDRTEIEALAKDCGLYVVEGRGTIGLALEHEMLKIYKDSWFRYCDRKDIVVKFSEEQDNGEYTGRFELRDLFPTADFDNISYRYQKRREPTIYGESGSILYGMKNDKYLMPELIIKAIVTNLKLRLDDLMKGGLLSKKKNHMNEIKNCGVEYDA